MAFRFRLEKVLSVRRAEEDTARLEHARAVGWEEEARASVRALEGLLEEAHRDLDRKKREGEITAHDLYLHTLYVAGLRRSLARARDELARASDAVRRTHEHLVRAHQDREALERLREREERRWNREQARRETRFLDEVALARRRGEEGNHGP